MDQPHTELTLPLEPGEHVTIPPHAHLAGHNRLQGVVDHTGPTFRWHHGDLWQQITIRHTDPTGTPVSFVGQVVHVRVRHVRGLDGGRRRIPSLRESSPHT